MISTYFQIGAQTADLKPLFLLGYGDNDLDKPSGLGTLRLGANSQDFKITGSVVSLGGFPVPTVEPGSPQYSSVGIGDLGSLLLDSSHKLLGFAPLYQVSNEISANGALYVDLNTYKAKAFISGL